MHIVVVHLVEIHCEHIVQVLTIQPEGSTVALLIVLGISCVHVECYRFLAFLRDDIYHATCGITSIESRCRALHYFNSFHVVHAQSGEIHIVHSLTSKSFAIDEKEHSLSAKTREIKMSLLVHCISEFHPRQFLLQEILHIRCIESGNLFCVDYTSLYGGVF